MIFKIINNPTPGIPNNPTIIEVNKFKPIWKLKFAPTKFIAYIKHPPNIELIINFKIFLSGQINILPNIKISIIPVKNVNIEFHSKSNPSKKVLSYTYFYD